MATTIKPSKAAERVGPMDQELDLARSLELQGKTAEAIYAYSTILAKKERADAHHRLAVLHDKRGNFRASEEHYQKALKLDPKNAELLCDRGFSYLLQGQMADAEDHLKKAIKRDPNLNRAHNNLGLLLGQQGHVDRALVEFAAAGCSHAEARTNLAYALTMAGKVADAEYHLQIARQTDASLVPASELAATLYGRPDGNAQRSDQQQLVTSSSPGEDSIEKAIEVTPTADQLLPETINQSIVTLPPTGEPYRVASLMPLDDYPVRTTIDFILPPPVNNQAGTIQIQQFEEVLPANVDVEPVTIQQPSPPKEPPYQLTFVQPSEPNQGTEVMQPRALRSSRNEGKTRLGSYPLLHQLLK